MKTKKLDFLLVFAVTLVLLASFTMSYMALYNLGQQYQWTNLVPFIFPIFIDLGAVGALLSITLRSLKGLSASRNEWFMLVLSATASIVGNMYHIATITDDLSNAGMIVGVFLFGIMPPVMMIGSAKYLTAYLRAVSSSETVEEDTKKEKEVTTVVQKKVEPVRHASTRQEEPVRVGVKPNSDDNKKLGTDPEPAKKIVQEEPVSVPVLEKGAGLEDIARYVAFMDGRGEQLSGRSLGELLGVSDSTGRAKLRAARQLVSSQPSLRAVNG